MNKTLSAMAALLALAAAAQAATQSALAPVLPRIEALVRQAQPQASFGSGQDILFGQYRAANHTIQPRDRAGHPLPLYQELGPLRGGFYLQVAVVKRRLPTRTQTTTSTKERPWTTVVSFYPLSKGRTIVMTWEAAPGAPRGLAPRIGHILSAYALTAH